MSRTLTLSIAGINIVITCGNDRLIDALCNRYHNFLTENEAQFQIDLTWENHSSSAFFQIPEVTFRLQQVHLASREFSGCCDISQRRASLKIGVIAPVEAVDYFLRVVSVLLIFQLEGLMVHGAGILHNGKGYLFLGHSGSGKTTVSRVSVNDDVLNDDLVALIPEETTWRMHSTPFYNTTQVEPKPLTAPLVAMYCLVQDKTVYLEPLTPGQALAEFLSSLPVITSNLGQSGLIIERCMNLLREVPENKLHFLPDDSFWQVIDN